MEVSMTVSSQLKAALKAKDATFYRIAKDADVDWGTLGATFRTADGRTSASVRWIGCASTSAWSCSRKQNNAASASDQGPPGPPRIEPDPRGLAGITST